MTKMRINLIPKPPRAETIERLRNAQTGAYQSLVYRLRKENELQQKLIEAYERYFNFMERRYPVENKPGRDTDAIDGTGSSKRKASQG